MKTKIKGYRVGKGLTQEELASLVGVRRETIVFLEKGKYNPSLKLGFDIAKVLGVGVEDLFSFDDFEGGGRSNGKDVNLGELDRFV